MPVIVGGGGKIIGCVDVGGGGKVKLELGGMAEDDVDIIAIGVRLEERGVCDLEIGEDEKVEFGFEAALSDGASEEKGMVLEDAIGTMGDSMITDCRVSITFASIRLIGLDRDKRSPLVVGDFCQVPCELDDTPALGGGARGGGSFVDCGDDAIIFDNPLSCRSSPSSSSALGTISERNSRSSEESARECRVTEPDDLLREKRLRNRETADAGAAASISWECNGGASEGLRCGAGVEAESEDGVTFVGDGPGGEDITEPVDNSCMLSTLAGGELVSGGGVLTGGTGDPRSLGLASEEEARAPRRPKKYNNPPPCCFLLSVAGTGSSFSMIRQPGGKRSSFESSGLDFMAVSHAVDPFEDM